jgi:hypothetical protein
MPGDDALAGEVDASYRLRAGGSTLIAAMSSHLRDRILRRLETLPEERLYQVLDYVEFLESKYAERQAPTANVFTRFAEGVEDRLRAGRVSASTIAETVGLMNKAAGLLSGVAAAGKSVATDIYTVASSAVEGATSSGGAVTPTPPAASSPPAASNAPSQSSGGSTP